jgi:hypothetical protein
MMGLAFAAFHWSTEDFWASTAHEFFSGYEVWQEMNSTEN